MVNARLSCSPLERGNAGWLCWGFCVVGAGSPVLTNLGLTLGEAWVGSVGGCCVFCVQMENYLPLQPPIAHDLVDKATVYFLTSGTLKVWDVRTQPDFLKKCKNFCATCWHSPSHISHPAMTLECAKQYTLHGEGREGSWSPTSAKHSEKVDQYSQSSRKLPWT